MMKTILVLMLLFLINVSAAPTRKAECRDQYGHCPEWSSAGYCDKAGYKTYMSFMCAHSCNTCQVLKQRNESQEEEDVASASGLKDGRLDNSADIRETTVERNEDEASANEPVSGDGEIHGDSDANEEKEEDHEVDRLQHEQSKDAAVESQSKMKQSTERKQRQSISEDDKDNQYVTKKQAQDKDVAATLDRDPPGVHLIKFQDNNIDDDINPRSKISTRPKENPSVNYEPLSRESKVQSKEITGEQDEEVSASGLDESGEGDGDESKSASPKASDKSTKTKGTSEESEEMKDIAGDIKIGSKIFEADISEPDSISGCSSGFGCFSGNGEENQTEKSQELPAVELEPRSNIATVPQVKDAKSQQVNKNIETVHGQTSPVSETASGSDTVVQDDIQNSGDDAPENDDITGAKSEANSNPKITTKTSETPEKTLEIIKNDEEDEKISTEKATSGSGSDVHDDIQGQIVHGDNDESIDSVKPTANSDALSGSGTDTTSKSESSKEMQTAPKSNAEIKKQNEQEQDKSAESEPANEESVAKSNMKTVKTNEQNEDMKNAAVKSISDQNQSAVKTEADNEEMNKENDDMKDVNDKSKSTNENETNSDKGNKQEGKQQQEDKIAKSKSTTEDPSASKNDVDSEPAETRNDERHGQDDTPKTNTVESKTNVNQSGEKIDKANQELNGQDVKPNDSRGETQNGAEYEEAGENDTSSGSGAASIDTNHIIDTDADEKPANDVTKSKSKTVNTQPTDIDDIEDALLSKKDTSIDNQRQAKEENQDLSSPAARQRITSMEELIKDDKPKAEKAKDAPANTRETVPSAEEKPDDFINTDLGKGRKISLILDQHYYKPYSNEDSMAYEMLALDLKKEVERAVGNQAIVSQISFSEIRKPGKLPRYSRVLATFMLHGDTDALHGAVRNGLVGDLMVDKKFFRASGANNFID